MGIDLYGNKYYEIIWEGKKFKREMISNVEYMLYIFDMMLIEWELWIWGKRNDLFIYDELLV